MLFGNPWTRALLPQSGDWAIYRRAVVVYGYRLAEVGDKLGLHYSTVSRIVGERSRLMSKVKT